MDITYFWDFILPKNPRPIPETPNPAATGKPTAENARAAADGPTTANCGDGDGMGTGDGRDNDRTRVKTIMKPCKNRWIYLKPKNINQPESSCYSCFPKTDQIFIDLSFIFSFGT